MNHLFWMFPFSMSYASVSVCFEQNKIYRAQDLDDEVPRTAARGFNIWQSISHVLDPFLSLIENKWGDAEYRPAINPLKYQWDLHSIAVAAVLMKLLLFTWSAIPLEVCITMQSLILQYTGAIMRVHICDCSRRGHHFLLNLSGDYKCYIEVKVFLFY